MRGRDRLWLRRGGAAARLDYAAKLEREARAHGGKGAEGRRQGIGSGRLGRRFLGGTNLVRRARIADARLLVLAALGLRQLRLLDAARFFLGPQPRFVLGLATRRLLGPTAGDQRFRRAGEADIGLIDAPEIRRRRLFQGLDDVFGRQRPHRLGQDRARRGGVTQHFARPLRGRGFETGLLAVGQGAGQGRRRGRGKGRGGERRGRKVTRELIRRRRGGGEIHRLRQHAARTAQVGRIGRRRRFFVKFLRIVIAVGLAQFEAVIAIGRALGEGRRAFGAPAGAEETREPIIESHQHLRSTLESQKRTFFPDRRRNRTPLRVGSDNDAVRVNSGFPRVRAKGRRAPSRTASFPSKAAISRPLVMTKR